jgi:hypothetical protein
MQTTQATSQTHRSRAFKLCSHASKCSLMVCRGCWSCVTRWLSMTRTSEVTGRPTDGPGERPGYVWDTRNNRRKGEVPIDKDNHFMDMERYMVAHFDLDPCEHAGRARRLNLVTTAASASFKNRSGALERCNRTINCYVTLPKHRRSADQRHPQAKRCSWQLQSAQK